MVVIVVSLALVAESDGAEHLHRQKPSQTERVPVLLLGQRRDELPLGLLFDMVGVGIEFVDLRRHLVVKWLRIVVVDYFQRFAVWYLFEGLENLRMPLCRGQITEVEGCRGHADCLTGRDREGVVPNVFRPLLPWLY